MREREKEKMKNEKKKKGGKDRIEKMGERERERNG